LQLRQDSRELCIKGEQFGEDNVASHVYREMQQKETAEVRLDADQVSANSGE
jgi:hypothetical protein